MSDPKPLPVIVSRSRSPVAPDKPWRWETPDLPATDRRFRGRYHFETCEEAHDDAVANGHTVVEVRE